MSMLQQTLNRPGMAPAIVAAVSAGALAAALTAQFVFGLAPCVLCIYQRYPYVIALVLGLAGIAMARRAGVQRLVLLGAGLAFLVGAGIAVFHDGVEQQWWRGTSGCHAPAGNLDMSLEELTQQLRDGARFVPCDEIPWSLFGISMAGYNALASALLAAAAFAAAFKIERGSAR